HPDLCSFPTRRSSDLALSLFPVPVRWRQALLAELALAAELACDRAAAGSAGGTRRVAEALTALRPRPAGGSRRAAFGADAALDRSEEHTSELQSRENL